MPFARYEHLSGSARTEARNVAVARYTEGATVRDIAAELGRSYGFVHRLLIEADIPLRSRGARTKVSTAPTEVPGQLELDPAL